MNFQQKLENIIQKNNSLLCVGLDPDMDKLPKHLLNAKNPIFEFNKAIIDATHQTVCAYKPNIAFYSAYGLKGLRQLKQTIEYINDRYTGIPIILDAKRGDVGHTASYYAKEVFDVYAADAVTVNPYLGFDSVEPFIKRKDKGIIVICKTSNPGSSDFQSTEVSTGIHLGGELAIAPKEKSERLYMLVARKVIEWNQQYGNCLLVVGATWPEELKKLRDMAHNMFFLVPGIGAQGGGVKETVENGIREDKSGLIINVSRAILYASDGEDFATGAQKAAEEYRNEINKYRL